jgi:hypothetical protein
MPPSADHMTGGTDRPRILLLKSEQTQSADTDDDDNITESTAITQEPSTYSSSSSTDVHHHQYTTRSDQRNAREDATETSDMSGQPAPIDMSGANPDTAGANRTWLYVIYFALVVMIALPTLSCVLALVVHYKSKRLSRSWLLSRIVMVCAPIIWVISWVLLGSLIYEFLTGGL